MLILIAGLPGSGKTAIASAFAAQQHVLHLNSDALRHQMGLTGRYSLEDKKKVYAALLSRTAEALQKGLTVVVDSTFYQTSVRLPFLELASAYHVQVLWVEIRASESTLRERLSRPRPDSEADYAVYEKIREQFEPLPDDRIVIWSDQTTPEAAAAIIAQNI